MQRCISKTKKAVLRDAIRYALCRWSALAHYCDDGRIEIDKFSRAYPSGCGLGVRGGPGYEDFLEVMANPKHPEHISMVERHGDVFDPAPSGL